MGLSLKSIGKSISKAFKGVSKTLQKAAPVLIPLAVAGVTGGLGSGRWLGKVGKTLLGGSNLNGILGNLAKGGIAKTVAGAAGNTLVDPATTGGGGGEKKEGSGGLFNVGGLVSKFLPTYLTQMIEGKPKSAEAEAAKQYSAAPVMTPAQAGMMDAISSKLKDDLGNTTKVSPLSTSNRQPISYGDPMQAAPAEPIQNTFSPIAPAGIQTGGRVGALAAPVAPVSPEQVEMGRRPRGFIIRRAA